MALITCEKIILGYGKKIISPEISFTVEKGELVCVTGENGIGKSTLVKTVLNLTPLVSGKISTGDGFSWNEAGYLSQQSGISPDFPATVREIVLSGTIDRTRFRPFYGKKEKLLAEASMERMEILALKNRSFRTLSGGQKQRVLLARALCAGSKLIFLDEPVTGLDPDATRNFYSIIKKTTSEGTAVLMVTHDTEFAFSSATKILSLKKDSFYFGAPGDYRC